MIKPKVSITNIYKIVIITLLVLFSSLIALPSIASAAPCPDDPSDLSCEPDTPPEAPPETPPGDDTESAASTTRDDVCEGLEVATGQGCDEKTKGGSVDNIVSTVINVLSWIVGVAAVIMLIISGFRFVISSGDTQAVANAKNGIIYAVIGLLIVLFAQVIVQFVIRTAVPT